MKNILNKLIIFLLIIFLYSCGFKIRDNSRFSEYYILNLETNSNNINFFIKQDLKRYFNNLNAPNKISVIVETEQSNKISEKNIKKEVTRYEIIITTKVLVKFLGSQEQKEIKLTNNGYYDVGSNHSVTMNNKKNIQNILAKKLSLEIANFISTLKNDF